MAYVENEQIVKMRTLLFEKKEKSMELLRYMALIYELNVELTKIDKEIEDICFEKTPKYLSRIEKLVYYFNVICKIPLNDIAIQLTYATSYILKVSARAKKKIREHKKKVQDYNKDYSKKQKENS